jgi:hypothetical protein
MVAMSGVFGADGCAILMLATSACFALAVTLAMHLFAIVLSSGLVHGRHVVPRMHASAQSQRDGQCHAGRNASHSIAPKPRPMARSGSNRAKRRLCV